MKKNLVVIGLLIVLVGYGLFSGRILVGDSYDQFKQFKKTYSKYFYIEDILDEEALEYNSASSDALMKLDDKAYTKLIKSMNDPYASYFTVKQYESFERMFAESYDGIGVTIGDVTLKGSDEIRVLVYSVFEDSPAETAGIKPGDFINKVDGEKVKNSDDACDHMLGKAGTEVKVTVESDGAEVTYTMNRAKIEEKPVKYKELDKKNKIGYIYVSTFKEGTCENFKLAVKDLQNAGYNKVIIDLRNNGGGMTYEAYNLADYLLPEGIIVTEKDKKGKEDVHKSDASSASIDYVVLVNKQTASASEIVACAIQDNKGGKIIGSKTYGKGVTQKTQKLADGSAIKFTIQEYFRPSGKTVNKVGVTPDIKVNNPDDDETIFAIAKKELLK